MSSIRQKLHGMHCATVSPVRDGEIDQRAVVELAEHLISRGITGLVPVGGTGEFTALSPRMRKDVVSATVRAARGRVPVIPGILSPGYAEAIETARVFEEAGADALLVITPFYTKTPQAGIRQYFKKFAQEARLPLMLYEIPTRTGIAVDVSTIEGMVDDGSIIGIKACNLDVAWFARLVNVVGDQIAVMGGDEPLFSTHVALGAVGGMLASPAVVPHLWNKVYETAKGGDLQSAQRQQLALQPLLDVLWAEPNPGPLKAALAIAGMELGEAQLPLGPPSAALLEKLQSIVPEFLARDRAASTYLGSAR